MVTFTTRTEVNERTESTNIDTSTRSNASDYRSFHQAYGESMAQSYAALNEFTSSTNDANELRYAELGNRAGLLVEWQNFINDRNVVNLAGFRNLLNEYHRNEIQGSNHHERTFQNILDHVESQFGDVKIKMPYTNEEITVSEAMNSGNLNLYLNTPEFRSVLNQAIESMLDPRNPQMQEIKRLSEEVSAEASERLSMGSQWFRGGLVYQAARQGSSLFKYNVVDRFTGKHAMRKQLIKDFMPTKTIVKQSTIGPGKFGAGIPKDVVRNTENLTDLKKYAQVGAKGKLKA